MKQFVITIGRQLGSGGKEVAERLAKTKIKGIWNFTGKDLGPEKDGIAVEDVHLGDSLMALCYEVAKNFD